MIRSILIVVVRFVFLASAIISLMSDAFLWLYVDVATLGLGHLPRRMLDDPKLILPDNHLYQRMSDVVLGNDWWSPCLLSGLGLGATLICGQILRILLRHTSSRMEHIVWNSCLIAFGIWLVCGWRFILWIAD